MGVPCPSNLLAMYRMIALDSDSPEAEYTLDWIPLQQKSTRTGPKSTWKILVYRGHCCTGKPLSKFHTLKNKVQKKIQIVNSKKNVTHQTGSTIHLVGLESNQKAAKWETSETGCRGERASEECRTLEVMITIHNLYQAGVPSKTIKNWNSFRIRRKWGCENSCYEWGAEFNNNVWIQLTCRALCSGVLPSPLRTLTTLSSKSSTPFSKRATSTLPVHVEDATPCNISFPSAIAQSGFQTKSTGEWSEKITQRMEFCK